MTLNFDSKQKIANIVAGFKDYPAYSSYQIDSYLYDPRGGIHALEISRNGNPINLFLFYPDTNGSGKIGSIAVYGAQLQGHYNAMRSSMLAFGIPITSISMEYGNEPFIDIYLNY